MTIAEHLAEDTISIIAALIGSLGVFIIHPRQHYHLAWFVVTEEQPILLEELGPEPVLVASTQCAALPILRFAWILRNDVESQAGDCSQALAGIFLLV